MTTRCHCGYAALLALASASPPAGAQPLPDPSGDSVLRRTDAGNDGPVPGSARLPDITNVTIRGWTMTTPGGDAFTGSFVTGPAPLVRIDAEFVGLLNPPGPLGLNGQPFDPYRFGPSPLYGFIEINVDADVDTGGQAPGAARVRPQGNFGRFGTRPSGPLAERTAESGTARDSDFFTMPYFERSGEDFALSWCGCHATTVLSGDDGDGIFEASETWTIRGRFFPRAAGYQGASIAYDGNPSRIGLYDPQVTLRWSHSASSNRTTVSLVYPLTPAGAAMLTGQPQQPIDTDIDVNGSHYSMQEALQDLINGANGEYGPVFEPAHTLVQGWAGRVAADYLDPDSFTALGIVGTTYSSQQAGALYVWTDVAFGLPRGDVNGDGSANTADASAVAQWLAVTDGTASDPDGTVNGVVPVADYGTNFCIYDVTGDGLVDSADIDFYPQFCPADWDTNGVVNSTDVSLYLNDWFTDLVEGGTSTDYDANGVVNSTDVSLYVNTWFNDVVGCAP
jgi:hypothetical protein